MRRISSRWLWVAGLLAATGGCRHAEHPYSGSPDAGEGPNPAVSPAVAPQTRPRPMPNTPSEAGVPVSSLKQDRPTVQQVGRRIAAPGQGHAPDHSWLVGRLERDEAKDRWYVRYADPGEAEAFGGRLELLRTGPTAGFRVGQAVRVQGTLVDPAPFEIIPAYRILSLQAIPE